jgi:hypothetical protein
MSKSAITFLPLAKTYFQYLIDDYGFRIVAEEAGGPHNTEDEGTITYENNTTFVHIGSELPGFTVILGRVRDKGKFFMGLKMLHEFLTFKPDEKLLLLSREPADNERIRAEITSKNLSYLSSPVTGDIIRDYENSLQDYARWLREYADPLLRGDFSFWLEACQYVVNWQRAEMARSGRDEYRSGTDIDKDGNVYKVERRSIFYRQLEYIEALRKE